MAGDEGGEWVRYWRSPDGGLEAMHARFRRHVYHRHSHETYSFGVTEDGAQSFSCRGEGLTSAAGMVMAFNPDDPHDGHATNPSGFTYRMVHVAPALVEEILGDAPGGRRRPLFAEPVLADPMVAKTVRRLHAGLDGGSALELDERLAASIWGLVRRGSSPATRSLAPARMTGAVAADIAGRVRELLDDSSGRPVTAAELAAAAGCSRYAAYRAFRATHGLAPSDYVRQLRLRDARRMLARGDSPAQAAAAAGFSDQSHLTRWFVRAFGITPGTYRRAAWLTPGASPSPAGARPPRPGPR